jgi:hypothetical protein
MLCQLGGPPSGPLLDMGVNLRTLGLEVCMYQDLMLVGTRDSGVGSRESGPLQFFIRSVLILTHSRWGVDLESGPVDTLESQRQNSGPV